MRIAYIGVQSGTTLHRANALRRLGHTVDHYDPETHLPKGRFVERLNWETGGLLTAKRVDSGLLGQIGDRPYDVLWVDHGRYVGRTLVQECRRRGIRSVVYNHDDPFGFRDRLSWTLYKQTLPHYDLVVVVREPNIEEAKRLGARDVVKVWRSADEVAHSAQGLTAEQESQYRSDVLFIGMWMPERGPFFRRLIELGVEPTIIGGRWQRAPEWPELRPYVVGGVTNSDFEYAARIQSATVCLGLLSLGNRDLHTTRSLEIPAIGGLFCAKRTSEHLELYKDGEEAVFWDTPEECAERALDLVAHPERAREIARRGHERCVANGTMNEPVMASVLERLMA
jgi:spore maturation protein CgeB